MHPGAGLSLPQPVERAQAPHPQEEAQDPVTAVSKDALHLAPRGDTSATPPQVDRRCAAGSPTASWRIATNAEVYTYDVPGHGLNGVRWGYDTLIQVVDDLIRPTINKVCYITICRRWDAREERGHPDLADDGSQGAIIL